MNSFLEERFDQMLAKIDRLEVFLAEQKWELAATREAIAGGIDDRGSTFIMLDQLAARVDAVVSLAETGEADAARARVEIQRLASPSEFVEEPNSAGAFSENPGIFDALIAQFKNMREVHERDKNDANERIRSLQFELDDLRNALAMQNSARREKQPLTGRLAAILGR